MPLPPPVTLRPAWRPTVPTPGQPQGHHSFYYENPQAPPGEIALVFATVNQLAPGTWRFIVTIDTTIPDGSYTPLHPYSGWGGTYATKYGACNAATRRARTLVRCASQGLPVP